MRLGSIALLGLVACADEASRNITTIENVMTPMDAAAPSDATTRLDGQRPVPSPAPACPAMWGECATAKPWRVIAEASRFGADARFTALAGDLVLVAGTAPRVVQLGPDLTPGEPSFVRSTAFPAGDWDARGLARTDGIAVIACDERCLLLEAPLGASTLRPGAMLPEGYEVRGLQASGGTLCVYGSDVSCLAGGRWQRTLDAEVVSLSLAARSVALAKDGRVFSASSSELPSWVEEAPAAGFTTVTAAGRRAFFGSDDAWLERTDGRDHACAVPDGIAAVVVAFGGSPSVLTGRGDLLGVRSSGYCRTQQLSQGPVLAASIGPCAGEPRVITARQLIGDNSCDSE